MPARILDKHVGGNTTYARFLAAGLIESGIGVGRVPVGAHPLITMMHENVAALRRGQPDEVLHYVADTGPVIPCSRPSVLTVHGVASRWISTARNPRQESVWRTRVGRAIESVDQIITVSESSADDVSAVFGLDRSSITVIPHGIDVSAFSTPTTVSSVIAERLPEHYALYIGNIEPRKNLVNLIKAFNEDRVEALGVPLVIAGKPAWNHRETMDLIRRSKNIIYLGFVSDQERIALMQDCSLFVFPSLYEGFGFPVLEALAAGSVVACSDRGSLRDVAGPSIRMSDLSPSGIAETIELGLTDSVVRDMCKARGVKWAEQFSWARSVRAHVEVYRQALDA